MKQPTSQPIGSDCDHHWALYSPPKRWWQRRVWKLFCHRCGGSAGAWGTKAEAIEHMTSNDWGH